MMLASTLDNIGIGDAAVVALLGYAVVFFGLILLMLVVMAMGKFFIAKDKKAADKAAAAKANAASIPVAAPAAAAPAAPVAAPGSAGQLKLYDVEPKTAAMLMAIVADKMGKPLNELRFISIKEVK
ncbi:MAG: OadG family protein [Oscillospiraceae bacterium]|nr:OadG family protein [Oscillospiraceae bacterium]